MEPLHRMLVVDDDHAIRSLLSILFERAGLHVDVAETGQQAIELIKRHGRLYCSVLLDLDIPPPNGVDVARFIIRMYPELPVIVISGRPDLAERLRDFDISDVVKLIILKPLDPAAVADYVHSECLRLRSEI